MNQEREHGREILDERVRLLYAQARAGLVATVINGVILSLVLWPATEHRWGLVAWLLTLLLITTARAFLLRTYRTKGTSRPASTWIWRFGIGALAIGACWGAAGSLLFPNAPAYQTFVLTILAGMSAGAVPLLGAVWAVYAVYAVTMLAPTAIWLWAQGGPVYPYIALMVLIYLGTVLASAGRISANIKESLRLRYERSDLIERLSRSKDKLEAANRQLAAEAELRRNAQRELEDSNRFLERVMESANDGIFVLDEHGRLCRINQTMTYLSGATADELTGKPFMDLFTPESRRALEPLWPQILDDDQPRNLTDLELDLGHGETRCLSVSIAPILGGAEGRALVGVARDVTTQRRLERMKEEFISTVSHELRTPLTSIRGALGLVTRADTEFDSQSRSLLGIANNNSERLLRLIDDLLDLQSLGSGRMRLQFSVESVAEMIQQAVDVNRAYAQQHQVALRADCLPGKAQVRVDRDRFLQVLTNLISNAAKFSPPGTEVQVYAEPVASGIRVAVKDHGPGVPLEFRDRIFERFSQADGSATRNKGGTGLGLSISKSLIEAMHGQIGFQSDIGKGSVFFVDLPLVPLESESSDARSN